jgi:hypothetical protein
MGGMSGLDLFGILRAEEKAQRKIDERRDILDRLICVLCVAAMALAVLCLAGCATPAGPVMCKRCGVNPAATTYKAHDAQESTRIPVCGDCEQWLIRKIRRKAVR